ncbi:MAG TPA: SprT family protein [Bacillota bacterium]|nr:SprT family protein [Bacillota bacterium]
MKHLCDEALTKQIQELSIKYFQKPFVDQGRYNNRLRTTGGRYIPGKRVIEINPKYVKEKLYDEVIGIIKHELCHYHLHIEGKPFGHGDRTFKELLRKTNSPRFCKPLPSSVKKEVIHTYTCTTCNSTYYRRRRVNVEHVRCGRCRSKIKYVSSSKKY